jgi:serine/threonine protein kinase
MTRGQWCWWVAQEISILKSISYDRNIVQFYGAVLSGSEPMLVLEYMEVRIRSGTCQMFHLLDQQHSCVCNSSVCRCGPLASRTVGRLPTT